MKYFPLRIVKILKSDNKNLISLVSSDKTIIISAVGPDGIQQLFPIAEGTDVNVNDVALIESYQKFPNFIEYKIVKIVKGKDGEDLLHYASFSSSE